MDITARTQDHLDSTTSTTTASDSGWSTNQIMRAVTSALVAGLFVLACCFGAPDGQSASDIDAHSDGIYDVTVGIALDSDAQGE